MAVQKRKSRATQQDVARLAQVDRSSVSKILCGLQPEHYSQEVIERVKGAAAELGYRHQNFKNSLIVGFLSNQETEKYTFAERTMRALTGISNYLHGSKHRLQIFNLNAIEEKVDCKKLARQADAFILWEMPWPWTPKFLDTLDKQGKGSIVINRVEANYSGSFIVHDAQEIYIDQALAVLKNHGHRNVLGVFNCPISAGLIQTCADIYAKHALPFSRADLAAFGVQDAKGCKRTARKIADGKYSAVFMAGNDMNALDLVLELARLGVKVPEDVSFIGNHKRRSLPSLGLDLSSFETPWTDMGWLAAEFLLSESRTECSAPRIIRKVLPQKYYPGTSVISI